METLLRADAGPVRVLTLNDPRHRNALGLAMRVELAEAIEAAMADAAVRAIVLTGAEGTFCAGGDLSTMHRQTADEARPRLEAAQRVVRAIVDGPTPVVAAVEGFAIGAGLGIALACDRVVAASDARFITSFTRVGLVGDLGIFWSLPRRVGRARARQMLMLPTDVTGTDAVGLGLVDRVVEPGTVLEAALEDAGRLAAGPPLALAAVKAMVNRGPTDVHDVLEHEIENQAAMFDTADFAEGLAALRDRRTPEFTGR